MISNSILAETLVKLITSLIEGDNKTIDVEGKLPAMVGLNCIIRSEGAGVFVGDVTHQDRNIVVLDNCRRLWKWAGACSLSQLAQEGVKEPKACRFSVITEKHMILNVLEVLPTTDEGKAIIYGVQEWKS